VEPAGLTLLVVSQFKQPFILTTYFPKIRLIIVVIIITIPFPTGLKSDRFLHGFPTKILLHFSILKVLGDV
jgi:hypothetical protein